MKKRFFILSLFIAFFAMMFTACSTEDDSSDTPIMLIPSKIKSSSTATTESYFPLVVGNSWTYTGAYTSGTYSGQSYSYTQTVTQTGSINGNTYYEITDGTNYWYYRQDSNGNLKYYSSSSNSEYIFIPTSPTLNYSWTANGDTYTINSLTATKNGYTDLLNISDADYYKKGVGRVYSVGQNSNGYYTESLTSKTLK